MKLNKRKTIVEWMIEQSLINNFRQCTMHQAILILDKYLEVESNLQDIEEIALMTLFLSCKMEEVQMIGLNDFSTNIFTDANEEVIQHLHRIELNILEKLKYSIYHDTIYQYVNAQHYGKINISSDYNFSCCLATILLTRTDYQYVPVDIIADKIINFTNLLKTNNTVLETIISNDILYSYFYLMWLEYISSNDTSIRDYYLCQKKYDIRSISVPQINCPYEINNITLKGYWPDTLMNINYKYNIYSKEEFDSKIKIKCLGTPGTFGSVNKVRINNKDIALKKILCPTEDALDGINYYMLRELNILFHLRHPNITNIDGFYYNREKMILYIGMDLMDTTIKTKIEDNNVPTILKYSYITQLLNGLEYIHSQNIMHRDLSTSNILVSNNGNLKISDFGISRFYRHEDFNCRYTNIVCTIYYRPLEILLGQDIYTNKMDIWSCACVIYFILMERDLFPGHEQIDMLFKIFRIFGTPSIDSCPILYNKPPYSHVNFPNWNRIGLIDVSKKFPKQEPILDKMLSYNECSRISAKQALNMFLMTFQEEEQIANEALEIFIKDFS